MCSFISVSKYFSFKEEINFQKLNHSHFLFGLTEKLISLSIFNQLSVDDLMLGRHNKRILIVNFIYFIKAKTSKNHSLELVENKGNKLKFTIMMKFI